MISHSRAAIMTAALTALLTLAGGAAATAAPLAASTSAAAARSGQEQFHLTSTVATSTRQQVQATGVLNAQGHAVLVGVIVTSSGTRDVTRLVFSHGTVRLVTEVTGQSVTVPDPTTCKFTESSRGDYQIRGGKGRFVHATGAGTYHTSIAGQLKRTNGNCTTTLVSYRLSTKTTGSMGW